MSPCRHRRSANPRQTSFRFQLPSISIQRYNLFSFTSLSVATTKIRRTSSHHTAVFVFSIVFQLSRLIRAENVAITLTTQPVYRVICATAQEQLAHSEFCGRDNVVVWSDGFCVAVRLRPMIRSGLALPDRLAGYTARLQYCGRVVTTTER